MTLQDRLDQVIDAALGARIVGCVVKVRQEGRDLYSRAAGLADREAGTPMREDTIFRLASVTKPIVATAALRMVEAGLLDLEAPVTRYLPWFTPPAPDGSRPPITLRQLLTHTSGLTYDVPVGVSGGLAGPTPTLEENLRRLAEAPLAFAPGSAWVYGVGIDVIGGVLAAVQGGTLGEAVAAHVTAPLGLTDTGFTVTDPARLATPYADGAPPLRMAEPQVVPNAQGVGTTFSPGRILNPATPHSGGAGMAGTAGDVLAILDSWHGDLLSPETRRMAQSDQIPGLERAAEPGMGFSLIGAVKRDESAREAGPIGVQDWGGAWGHHWILEPAARLTLVVCTNTAFEGCNGPFRTEIRNALFA